MVYWCPNELVAKGSLLSRGLLTNKKQEIISREKKVTDTNLSPEVKNISKEKRKRPIVCNNVKKNNWTWNKEQNLPVPWIYAYRWFKFPVNLEE